MARILIHTLGSSGDFNPFISLGRELASRSHDVCFAVNPANADKINALGLNAISVGPDWDEDSELMQRLLRPALRGPIQTLFRDLLVPAIVPATQILTPLAKEADVFISHTIQLGAPAVAQLSGTPWISASPQTNCYRSDYLPAPTIAWKQPPPYVNRLLWTIARTMFYRIDRMANVQYRRMGVAPRRDVVISGSYSPRLTMGLWSPSFFPRPRDWPSWLQIGGYARWDAPAPEGTGALELPRGQAPLIVFTLGSNVVKDPRDYYDIALEAVARTGWRAVLLGAPSDFEIPLPLRDRVVKLAYACYSDIFPKASVVVHQGGIGTTQAACYYGVPSLVVPRGFDQFENAAHIRRNGYGLRLMTSRLSARRLRAKIERIIGSFDIRQNVRILSARMQREPGVVRSADLVEAVISSEKSLRSMYRGAPTPARPGDDVNLSTI
jgi:UDP:flavonoid glycosyltransferase YjiC (YdhE family)